MERTPHSFVGIQNYIRTLGRIVQAAVDGLIIICVATQFQESNDVSTDWLIENTAQSTSTIHKAEDL